VFSNKNGWLTLHAVYALMSLWVQYAVF